MNNILILYPKLFNCYSKFNRKLSRILKQLKLDNIVFPDDPNNFIKRYFEEYSCNAELLPNSEWNTISITHAIIFDDGEEFFKEIEEIKQKSLPLRIINISITRVVNINKEKEFKNIKSTDNYEYIGRGSYWGNPYSMYEDGEDREEVIRKYKYDFDFDKFPNKKKIDVYKLAGKRLGCFCKPSKCHGDILAEFLNQWDDGN
ncbi:MAG: DUF4326 domain-containing protein [Desulfamplus sp.]|nr:DUF4326 domain-containing protein [Desulfamplus sp.]